MPASIVKSLARKSGQSLKDVERKWQKAKALASQSKDASDPQYYALVVGILKRLVR